MKIESIHALTNPGLSNEAPSRLKNDKYCYKNCTECNAKINSEIGLCAACLGGLCKGIYEDDDETQGGLTD